MRRRAHPFMLYAMHAVLAISVGASLGALLRWLLAMRLNALWPVLPLGTLAANLAGGYLIGVALAVFGQHPALAPEWRLFLVTGFLGGLTTFSAFSAEVVAQLQRGELAPAAVTIVAHVIGSLLLTFAGFWIATRYH